MKTHIAKKYISSISCVLEHVDSFARMLFHSVSYADFADKRFCMVLVLVVCVRDASASPFGARTLGACFFPRFVSLHHYLFL